QLALDGLPQLFTCKLADDAPLVIPSRRDRFGYLFQRRDRRCAARAHFVHQHAMYAELQILEKRGQIWESAEALRADGTPESLKGPVDPIIVRLSEHRRRGVLGDVGQNDAAVLEDDGFPGVVLALDHRTLEDLVAIRIVAIVTFKKSQRLLAT